MANQSPRFSGGVNIALKIPKIHFERTVAFYRDVLGFDVKKEENQNIPLTCSLQFGPNRVWLDCVDNYASADVWLELETDDIEAAQKYLQTHGTVTQPELEPLSPSFKGRWISNPAGIVHLVVQKSA